MLRRLLLICTLLAFAGIFVVTVNPVNSRILKLAFLGCLFGVWAGFTILTWQWKPFRMIACFLPVIAAIPFILPGREIDVDDLRQDYVKRMAGFEGTKYYWGGENSRGIDCSGLPRRALRDALLGYAVRHFNGHAFRCFIEQWWFDASARGLGEGYRDYTNPIGTTGTIREMDYEALAPGDIAVTKTGVHVIAYAGDGRWIQADPGIGAVATLDGRKDENSWFRTAVTTHRWQILAETETTANETP